MRLAPTRAETLLLPAAPSCDHAIHAATGQLCSGHTLKHLIAALAAAPVIAAAARRAARQNGRNRAVQAA
jgi:hypothetical protein